MKEFTAPVKRDARRAFERAAASYDSHAVLHREVGARLLEHLDPIRVEPRRIVDVGCGTGGSLEALRKRFPRAQVLGLDFAPAMLREAAARGGWLKRAFSRKAPRLVCADAERLPFADGSIDFLFSNLALQWCRPEAVFAEASRVLPVGGLIMFSTLGPDTLKELRAAFAASDADAHVHAFIDMHDLGDALVHAGFAEPVMEMEALTIEYAKVGDLAGDLRGTGARNALPQRRRGLATPARWKRMVEAYDTMRRGDSLPATFEIVYGHAWKAAPRRAPGDPQVIEFRTRGAR
ncbi:MAG: malonyl-ACP O-methyltransferase BioC [Usitatibacter sp.]